MRTQCGTILAAVLSLSANANSVASFCERAQKGDRLTVAFLGGSLSWGANATDPNKASWRALIGRRLEERYPDAHFKFVDAAIGGTGSGLGIFRLERDVIPYKPDIVFVEWLVNDGEMQEFRLGSICVAGRNAAWVSRIDKVEEFVLLTTEAKWYRNNRMTGKGVPELDAAAAAGDDFVVDYVRVYDLD